MRLNREQSEIGLLCYAVDGISELAGTVYTNVRFFLHLEIPQW